MHKILTSTALFVLISLSSNGQNIMSADGKSMGPKSDFIDVCTKNMNGSDITSVEGFRVLEFCSCMADDLLPTLTKVQLNYYFKEGHMTEMFDDEKSQKILMDCIRASIQGANPSKDSIPRE